MPMTLPSRRICTKMFECFGLGGTLAVQEWEANSLVTLDELVTEASAVAEEVAVDFVVVAVHDAA